MRKIREVLRWVRAATVYDTVPILHHILLRDENRTEYLWLVCRRKVTKSLEFIRKITIFATNFK